MVLGTKCALSKVSWLVCETQLSLSCCSAREALAQKCCVTHSCLFRGVRHERRLCHTQLSFSWCSAREALARKCCVTHSCLFRRVQHERCLLRSVTACLSHTAVSCAVFGMRGVFEKCCVTHSCLFRGVRHDQRLLGKCGRCLFFVVFGKRGAFQKCGHLSVKQSCLFFWWYSALEALAAIFYFKVVLIWFTPACR